jgi:glycosyltransferase involved in cell wall biosynthesis
LLALFRLYRQIRPHVVFHYTIKPNIYGTLAAALARVPSVAVTTGLGYVFIQDSGAAHVAKKLYRLAFRFPREIWFLNNDDHEAFLRERLLAHPERARLLRGEGIDLQRFTPVTRAKSVPFTFILIGRLLWDKGVAEYVDAARALRTRFPQARWQLLGPVGVANPSAISRTDVERWQAEGVIEYLGTAGDVRPFIAAADCVVLPSYREGVPRTLLEAAAMARPIVATRVPGCVEVVDDGVTGFLCEARDAGDLADKMARIMSLDAAEYAAFGARARHKMVEEFDERVVIAHYFETLRRLTGIPIEWKKSQ